MAKKYLTAGLAILVGLSLVGCSTTDPNASPKPSASSDSPAGEGAQVFDDPSLLVYPGGMPRAVDPATIANLTIPEGMDQAKAKEAYAWVASYAVMSFNETSFQNMKEMRQYSLFAISQYFSPNALKSMEGIFSEYAKLNKYDDLLVADNSINNYGIVTIIPKSGTQATYLNTPVFDQVRFGAATIEEYEVNVEGLPVYKVSFPFSARLQYKEGADKEVKNLEASRTFEIWVVETGDAARPYLIETWSPSPLKWRTTN